jgi:hypothetical protein
MTRPHRLLLLVVPLALGLASLVLPGAAQQAPSGRYAFADTTLLRDTLGLSFERLLPLADSLSLPPDTLRALSIRYRYSLERLVKLADSLGMPVDSVGVVMLRERYNPLAAGGRRVNSFTYNSSYNIAQTSSTWSNGSDYNLVLGSVFMRNNTSITMDRYGAGGRTSLRQTRSSNTETGWKFSPNFSAGGRVNLDRFDSRDPGAANNEGESKNEFQLSLRSRQQPTKGLTSELNFFSGLLDLASSALQKRGLSGDLSGRLRYARGTWLTHDASGQLTGNLASTEVRGAPRRVETQDFSDNLRGTLGLFSASPASFNLNYNTRDAHVQTAGDSGRIQNVLTNNNGVDMTLRLRRDNDRYLTLAQRFSNTRQASASLPSSQNTRGDNGFNFSGRYGVRSVFLDGNFGRTLATTKFPHRGVTGGYGEDQEGRSIDGTLTWNASRRLSVKANGGVSLTRLRYFIIGSYLNPPVPRDQYRQSYRIDANFTQSQRLNSGLALEVSRTLFVNIPAASTAANNETRSYRAEWRWSYRLLSGLTATQRNQLTADYIDYTFLPSTNDRLSLDYNTLTVLNAVITPRLQLDLTHNQRFQPSGTYAPLDPPLDDGNRYFGRADDSHTSSLRARLAYTPAPALSLTIEPEYLALDRNTTSNGESIPQRSSRTLNFAGGASLNFAVGARGRLTGDIQRTFRADRSSSFSQGVERVTPTSQTDYWVGSLQLTWNL